MVSESVKFSKELWDEIQVSQYIYLKFILSSLGTIFFASIHSSIIPNGQVRTPLMPAFFCDSTLWSPYTFRQGWKAVDLFHHFPKKQNLEQSKGKANSSTSKGNIFSSEFWDFSTALLRQSLILCLYKNSINGKIKEELWATTKFSGNY